MVAVLEHLRGPVVDGTPYADQAFVAELNAYHGAAARAHREHSQEQLSLPVPVAAAPPWTMPVAVTEPEAQGLNGHNPGQRRCLECGAETAQAAQVCAQCGAPVAPEQS